MGTFAEGTWEGPPKIILGIDIGTTQSAVSFAYLHPDCAQYLHRVTAWPGQEAQKWESKIPTLVYYDSDRTAVSFGAEALKPETMDKAEGEGWQLARHFKLHVTPGNITHKYDIHAQPLPTGVSLHDIYSDFMVYLLNHTRQFFESRIVDGPTIWANHHEDMTVVLAHPNGWGIREQGFLRQAAIAANYVTSSKARSQIQFVSEGEASVHYCMLHDNLQNYLNFHTKFVVCDAGGLTVDTAVYRVNRKPPCLEIEEIKGPACVQAGGIFVDREFEEHLRGLLSRIDTLDDEDREVHLRIGVQDFQSAAKKRFDTGDRKYMIDLGDRRLKQEDLGIRRGVIALEGGVMQSFFDKSLTQIIKIVREQMSGIACEFLLIVGGFGDSLYLRRKLIEEFRKDGCAVNIANESTANAVADGAIIWCGKYIARSRVPRMSYGLDINVPYNPDVPSHHGRRLYRHAAGYDYLIHGWSMLLAKDTLIGVNTPIYETYWCSYKTPNPRLDDFKVSLFAYTGTGTPGHWLRDPKGSLNEGFIEVCEIEFDLNTMRGAIKRRVGRDGDFYFLVFTILFMFGRTELGASVEWEQDGKVYTMPTRITPSPLLG